MAFEYLIKVFQNSKLFHGISLDTIKDIVSKLRIKRVVEGTVIIKEGKSADKFYIIRNGKVAVRKKIGFFRKKTIAHLYNGDCFGEMALVEDRPRNATVVAEEYTELFTLDKTAFDSIIMTHPELKKNIEYIINERKNGKSQY
ncbi:MAG: cyclic nucleotide-binding domain-containing protein [Pseudomonadota bacterium]